MRSEDATAARKHAVSVRNQKAAFIVIRSLSVFTILILALILSFILWRGLRYSNLYRTYYLPFGESTPEGLAIVVNADQDLKSLEWTILYGMFTDEYINWAKIDGSDNDLLPVAVDPGTSEGKAVESFLFGLPEDGDVPLWGSLVQTAASVDDALKVVSSTVGSVTVVPAVAAMNWKGVKSVPLRRVVLAANPGVLDFVENDQIRDLTRPEIAMITEGKVTVWKAFNGPDIPVVNLAPPVGSDLERVLREAGIIVAGKPALDMAGYVQALSETEGAAGYLFGREQTLAELPALMQSGRESGWNLTFRYLFEAPRLSGRVGGISTIIVNTVYMLLLTVLFGAPIGIAAAVYMVEYARQGRLLRILRLGTETLAGIPSIIFGLFGFIFFVSILKFGFGLLSGSLTLTLMILPTIVRTSEEALKSVSRALREGSLALGATKLQTIVKVVIPAAAPGILTGVILAVGRAVGETAALLFTMGSDYQLARGVFGSARALATHVYLLFAEGISFDRAFSTATVLVVVVLVFNFTARSLIRRMNRSRIA